MAVIFPPAGTGGGGEGGVTDHGALTGLGDDDHTQYLNNTRGDARYYGQSAVNALLADKAEAEHEHEVADIIATGTASGSTYLRGDGAWVSLGSSVINLVDSLEDIPGDAAVDSLWAVR